MFFLVLHTALYSVGVAGKLCGEQILAEKVEYRRTRLSIHSWHHGTYINYGNSEIGAQVWNTERCSAN